MESKLPKERYTLEIFLAARNLANLDLFSKSDPFCIVDYELQGEPKIRIGETEVIENNLNPTWEKTFTIDYHEDLIQRLLFEVLDKDRKGVELMGCANINVLEILSSQGFKAEIPLKDKKDKISGKLIVKIDMQVEPNTFIQWTWRASNLINTMGFFSKSDPILIFYKWTEGDVWLQAYKTEVIKENLNPTFKAFEVSTVKLCNKNDNQKFKVEIWDYHSPNEHRFMGEITTTLNEILNQKKLDYEIQWKKGRQGGILHVQDARKFIRPTFRDYLEDGEQINLMFGIDYSLKNGDQGFPDSLHHIGDQPSHYEQAMESILTVLLPYDSDKFIPIYGFGGIPHLQNLNQDHVLNCFPLTGDFRKPEVQGKEVIKLYRNTINQIEFSGNNFNQFSFKGPSKVCDLVNYSKAIADANTQKKLFLITVILTQGEIEDLDQLTSLLGDAPRSPFSLIVVDVGKLDSPYLKNLDKAQKAKQSIDPVRSMVTSIQFNQCGHNIALLKKALLSQLPNQLCSYKQLTGQRPSFTQ